MKTLRNLTLVLALILVSFSCTTTQTQEEVEYGEATKELIALLDSDAELKSLLEASLAKAKEINPDPNTNPAQSLEDYYEFVTWTETAMPWALMKKDEYPEIFNNIFQGICAFYFLIDQPLPELEGQRIGQQFITVLWSLCRLVDHL